MRINKKVVSLIIALGLFISMALPSFAASYSIEGADIEIEIPEEAYVFTPATSDLDPMWSEAGITNPVEQKTLYSELGVSAQFSMDNNETNVYFARKQTESTEYYFNLQSFSEEEMNSFIDTYNIDEGSIKSTASLFADAQVPFIRTLMHSDVVSEEGTVYELSYFTIINGYSVNFSTHSTKEITAAQENAIKAIISSAKFTNILPTPERVQANPALAITVLVLLIAAIVAIVLVFKANKKKKKMKIRELADRLSAYRALGRTQFGEKYFVNDTDHSPEAIKMFSNHQAYSKNIFSGISTVAITLAGTIVSYYSNAQWWISLLLVVALLFCVYRLLTASGTIEKTLSRVYSKMKSTAAHYEFFAEEFTISGMQSREVYPYFQITDFRENRDYFYIYFGDENTYFVKKDSFSQGNKDGFKAFINERIHKNKGK